MTRTHQTADTFSGSKIALLCDGLILTYKRDNFEHIPWPGLWDLPGGGREAEETPEECALRELEEEFNLRLHSDRIVWKRRYESQNPNGLATYFLAADLTEAEVANIRFGSEGQTWDLVPVTVFLETLDAVPHLVQRLKDYLVHAA